MAILRQRAPRRAARPPKEPAAEWDEALLLEQTGGLLTAPRLPGAEAEWDMAALFGALRAGEVTLPLSEAEEKRFRLRTRAPDE